MLEDSRGVRDMGSRAGKWANYSRLAGGGTAKAGRMVARMTRLRAAGLSREVTSGNDAAGPARFAAAHFAGNCRDGQLKLQIASKQPLQPQHGPSMKRILIVKVTSMGDVIQAQPIVSDLKRAFPGVEVDWAVDESFAEIARWNPGTDRVLCAPLRRFKKARRWSDFKAIWESIAELRAYRYDVALDIHGVYKSAIISFLSRSRKRLGYGNKHLGERGAAFAY